MANSRKLIVEVVGDASKLERSLKGVESRTTTFSRRMQGKGGLAGGLLGGVSKGGAIGAGAAAGAGIALVGLKKVIAAAKDAQVAEAGLAQAFASAGVSAAKSGKQVDRVIQSVSKLSGFDDEDVSRSFANLLRTTGSIAKATRDSALAANIARARRISLAAATKVVEKAETGQLRGLKALGVQIDKNTTSSEAIDRAQRKFAGSAEAYGRTAQGAQDKLAVAFENLEEKVGAKLLPVLTKLTLKLIELFDSAEKNWPKFAAAVGDAYRVAKPFIDQTVGIIKGVSNQIIGLVRLVNAIFNGEWAQAWKAFKQFSLDGVLGVVKAVATLPLKIAGALGRQAFAGLSKVGTWIKDAIVGGVEAAINRVISLVNSLLRKLKPLAGVLGKVGIDVKIPQIAPVGAPPRSRGSSTTGARPDEGTRGTTVIKFEMDGRQMNTRMTSYRQQTQKRNPPQRRGPNAGLVSG